MLRICPAGEGGVGGAVDGGSGSLSTIGGRLHGVLKRAQRPHQ